MRIVHLIPSMNPADGGPVTAVRDFVTSTARLGCSSEIASIDSPDAPWVEEIPCPIVPLGPGFGPLRSSSKMRNWLCQNASRFDIAVVHGVWLYPTQCARQCRLRTGLPYVVYTHGMLDVTHRRVFPLKHLKKSLWWLVRERRSLSEASALFFTCEEERKLSSQSFWPSIPFINSQIAPYCVEPPPDSAAEHVEAFRSAFSGLTGRRLLLFLGRIHPKKGVDLLLEAFITCAKREPRLTLMVAGPGDEGYINKLKRRAMSAGITDRILWPGMLLGDLKWGALRSADLFCLPSHQENFGIAITEALACGTPVLVSHRVNIAKTISGAGAAFTCDDNQVSTTEALQLWLQQPEHGRHAMRKAAIRCFEEEFRADVAAKRFIEALESARGVERSVSTSERYCPGHSVSSID